MSMARDRKLQKEEVRLNLLKKLYHNNSMINLTNKHGKNMSLRMTYAPNKKYSFLESSFKNI